MMLLGLLLAGTLASAPTEAADKSAPVQIPVVDTPPQVDGRLDDAAWSHAVVLSGFVQTSPGDNIAASQPTEVLLCRDRETLYVAFRAHDEAGAVRATVARRDDILADDYVGMYLDTFDDRRKAYVLFFNPFGIQSDAVMTVAQGMDFSVDVLMRSVGVVSEQGYTVEVAIPFKSLRCALGTGAAWGVHFVRSIKRLDEMDSWMPVRRDVASLLKQSGHVTGFDGVAGARTLELIPSLTLSAAAQRVADPGGVPGGRIAAQPTQTDPGGTLKYTISSGVATSLAINPDFAQVEADEPVVTGNQRFPIYYAEKRPLFLEGIDVFQTPLNIVHTRTVVDPDVAVNLTGKQGREGFGLLLASDKAPGNYSEAERADPTLLPQISRYLDKSAVAGVLRLRHDLGRESSLGLVATTRDFVDDHNHVVGGDGRFRIDDRSSATLQAVGTFSRLAGSEHDGFGYSWRFDRQTRRSLFIINGEGRSPGYRAESGFTTRTDTHLGSVFLQVGPEAKPNAQLLSWDVHNLAILNGGWAGGLQDWYRRTGFTLHLRRQTNVTLDESDSETRLIASEFAGGFAGAPERRRHARSLRLAVDSTPVGAITLAIAYRPFWGEFDYDFGNGPRFPRVSPAALVDPHAPLDPGGGTGHDLDLSADVHPSRQLRLTLAFTRSLLRRDDNGRVALDERILSLRSLYQFTRIGALRLRADYDTLGNTLRTQALLAFTPSPDTSLYIGVNHDAGLDGFSPLTSAPEPGLRLHDRTLFIKLSYLLRKPL
jgi:hypothetical protein